MSWFSGLFGPQSNVKEASAKEVQEMLQSPNGRRPLLVDVRERDEFAGGHIPGAVSYPLSEIRLWLQDLHKERPIVCVCRSGRRSDIAANQLYRAGYEDVTNLVGGMIAWSRERLPVER